MFSWVNFLSYAIVTAVTPGPNNIMSMSNAGRLGTVSYTHLVTGCSSGSTESTAEGETAEGAAEGGALDDNVLTVAMACGYAPYNWTQPTDANGAVQIKDSPDYAYGYDVMMAKHIAEELGMELEIVKLDWDSLVPAVQSGTVDCVIAGQSITSERKEMVDFTEPYYLSLIHIFHRHCLRRRPV